MIGEVMIFLKDRLNAYLKIKAGISSDDPGKEQVVFIDGGQMEPITFELGAVSILLINVEEERVLRDADPYTRVLPDGSNQRVYPDIRLNLYVLFVARFSRYEDGLNYLSLIIRYFQNHRLLDHQNAPGLDERVEKLIVELITLPFSEQNEIWNALRTTYHPSVLYKVSMVVFRDEDATPIPGTEQVDLGIKDSGRPV